MTPHSPDAPTKPELSKSEWHRIEHDFFTANLMLGYTRDLAAELARREMNSKYRREPVGG